MRAPIDRGHFDFGAQSGFGYRDWHAGVDVVAAALEIRMGLHVDNDVQIARRRAVRSGIAVTSDADARSCFARPQEFEFRSFQCDARGLRHCTWRRFGANGLSRRSGGTPH